MDNFNGNTLGPSWDVYDNPGGATPRTTASVEVAGGYLNLIGHNQAPYGYVGGGISFNTNQIYGQWVIRFRADNGAGFEPAVLLWPESNWPTNGEIDIAEVYPGSVRPASTNRLGDGQFVHISPANTFLQSHLPFSVNFAQWQTVAVTWLPGQITWSLDGKQTWSVTAGEGGKDYIPDTPFHLALQMDAGCTPGHECRTDSSTPKQVVMQVDWVKIYAAP